MAVTQCGHAFARALEMFAGASAVRAGSCCILFMPTCRRRCICAAATSGCSAAMCDTVFDECVLASASARGICCVLASGLCWLEYPFFGMSRVDAGGQPDLGAAVVCPATARHANSPRVGMPKGSFLPVFVMSVHSSPKRTSTWHSCQSCRTEISESVNVGIHRTLGMVMLYIVFLSSRTTRGRSPMREQS